jgi:hypothetical protein
MTNGNLNKLLKVKVKVNKLNNLLNYCNKMKLLKTTLLKTTLLKTLQQIPQLIPQLKLLLLLKPQLMGKKENAGMPVNKENAMTNV